MRKSRPEVSANKYEEISPTGNREQLKYLCFPGRSLIDTYGNGGFRFANMSRRGSLMCLPSGIYGWAVDSTDHFMQNSFARVFEEADNIEILLVGSGHGLLTMDPSLRSALHKATISADVMSTGAAVRTFNILLGEGRAVAAALLAVE